MNHAKQIEKAKKVLKYWHTMEFLSQENYDPRRETQKKAKERKALYRAGKNGEKTLWDYMEDKNPMDPYETVCQEAASCGMKEWGRITVYLGRIRREACIRKIAEALPAAKKEERCEKSYDEIVWASFQLSPDGTYIEHSLSLSPVIWAMAQLKNAAGLSGCMDEGRYLEDVKELEKEILSEKVSGALLGSLSQKIQTKYLMDGIDWTGEECQENYGLYVPLFRMRRRRKNRRKTRTPD